jgi:hypothetical protein
VTWGNALAILALVVSGAAAWFARRSAYEAVRANNLSRLNALLALRSHYLAQIEYQGKLLESLANLPAGLNAAQEACADLDTKIRAVTREIDGYHSKVVGSRT